MTATKYGKAKQRKSNHKVELHHDRALLLQNWNNNNNLQTFRTACVASRSKIFKIQFLKEKFVKIWKNKQILHQVAELRNYKFIRVRDC